MLFFVILFFLNCSASNGPLYIYEGQEKAYFFDAPLIQKQINYLNGFTIKKAETFKLPDQKYDLIFNSFQSIFEWDFKSLCVVYFKKIQRISICDNFEKNIKKILDHKNFKNNGTEVEITIKCTKHMNIPLCQLILKMCFADSFVTIQLNDKMIQYINEQNITWTPDLITLDRGLMPLFDTLRKTKRLNDIIKNFKKSNNSKLSFYEKIWVLTSKIN